MNRKGVAVAIAVMTVLSGLTLLAGAPRALAPAATPGPTAAVPLMAGPAPAVAPPDMGWQTPAALESQTSATANLAGVALSSDGTGMIVWQKSGVRNTLMATHFIPNGGGDGGTDWQVPVQVSNSLNDIGYTSNGAVAMDAFGDAMAVYYSWNDTHGYTAFAALYKAGVGWQAPVAIDQPYDWSFNPVVSMNAAGKAVAVWEVWNGAYYSIFANRFAPATGWGTAQAIETTANYSVSPTVAVDGAGNAIATWYAEDGSTYHVYAAQFSTTLGWLPPFIVETSANWAVYPSVAMDAGGNGVVTWIEYDGQYDVWAKLYNSTSGWAPATMIEPGTYSAGYYPGPAAAAAGGNASVVWTMQNSTGASHVYVNRYVAGTGWVGAIDLDIFGLPSEDGLVAMDPTGNVTITFIYLPTTSPANQVVDEAVRYNHVSSSWTFSQLDYDRVGSGSPLVAIDGKGNAIAAWDYNAGTTVTPQNGILSNYYTNGSGWRYYWQAQQAEWENDISPSWLQLETNPAGDAIFSFTQNDGPIWDGYAALYTPGGGWGPVTRIENFNVSGVTEEWSAIDGAGNALVLFRASDGIQYNVYAAYYHVGTGWGAPQRLDSAVGSSKDWLRVAMNSAGDGVAIWNEYNGTNYNAYAAFFNGTTRTWGAPSPVQSTFVDISTGTVGIDGRGDAMAVYQAYNGTGWSNYASYFQPGLGWGSPVQIARNPLGSNPDYAVEMNDAGDVAVSWTDWNGSAYLAAVNVFSPTTGWGTDQVFNTGVGDEGPATPSLDGAGNALLAYNVWNGTQFGAYAVFKPVGSPWGTPVEISSGSGDSSGMVSALDYHGNGFVAWSHYNGVGYDIVSRRYVSAEGWMPQATVNLPSPAGPATNTGSAVLGLDGHGDAILGWNEWENGALLPFAATYIVGSGQPTLTLTSPANGTLTNNPTVTVSGTTDPGAALTIDGAPVAVAVNGSFSKTYSLPDGSHTFVVVAKNAAGLSAQETSTVAVDTTAPALSISTPTTGSLTRDAVAQVNGTTEPGATVSVNGVLAVVSGAGDFSVALPLQEGLNTITAIATDAAGNTATTSVLVTLDTIPPTLTLTSPTAGLTNHTAVVVSGSTDPGVTLTVDGTPVTVGISGAFTTTLTLSNGPHTVVVNATDAAGNQASDSVVVTVDTTPPSLAITTPTTGSLTRDPFAQVNGTTDPGATVAVNGVQAVVSASGDFSVALPLEEGLNTVTAIATNAAGNTATTSVTVTLDTVPPALALTSPTAGLTNHTAVVVSGTTEPGATVTVDGTPVIVGVSGAFTTTLTLANGPHTIVVVATDAAGNQATASVLVTVDTTPPSLTISSPITGSITRDSIAQVNGTTDPGATVAVNGVQAAVSGSGGFSVSLPLEEGLNTVTAVATNAAGNTATTSVTVTLDDVPPALALTSPTTGLTNHSAVVVSGTTEPGATVTVDGSAVTVGVAGAFTTTLTLADGAHTIVVNATDAAGNRATVSVQVTVDTTAPSLAITSPTTGASVSTSDILVTGTAEAGSTVVVDGYAVALSGGGTFSIELPLSPGTNTITVTATDPAGNVASRSVVVSYAVPAAPTSQSSTPALSTLDLVLIVVAAAALALCLAQSFRGRKPKEGPTEEWKERPPEQPQN
ncbi:MAG: Ig-like domain-containing protein [Thermoplasmata archaeon]